MHTFLQEDLMISELFDALPEAVILFKPVTDENYEVLDFEIAYCNNASSSFLRAPRHVVLSQTILNTSLLNDTSKKALFQQCVNVWQSGKSQEESFYNEALSRHFSIRKSKINDGVISVTRDKTEYINAEKARKEQTALFTSVLDASADGVMILEALRNEYGEVIDFKLTHCNIAAFELAKIAPASVGKTLLEILPHLKSSEQLVLHKRVIETGLPERIETTFRNENGEEYGWFIVSLMKMADNVVSTFIDVSHEKHNRQKIEEQSSLLASIFEASINGIFACEAIRGQDEKIIDLKIVKVNKAFTSIIDVSAEDAEGAGYHKVFPSGKKLGMFDLYCKVIETGKNLRTEIFYDDENIMGWYDVSAVKFGNNGIVITFTNITEGKQNKQAIEDGSKYLQDVINNASAGMFTLHPVFDKSGEMEDFRFAIVNQAVATYIGEKAENLTGALGSEFFPAYKANGLFNIYKDTFLNNTEHKFDFHYEDGYDVYFNIHTVKAGGEVLVTFTDHTTLKKLQVRLETSIEELKKSNASLEEFAYAASHDLQEPLRKINYFSERLRKGVGQRLLADENKMFERMENAASRMSQLITDLLTYSQISRSTRTFETSNLDEIVQQVLSDLETTISLKKANVTTGHLPAIKGDPLQLRQMLQNLLSNSLKYSKAEVPPVILIESREVMKEVNGATKTFYEIKIRDNGIGFEQENAEKIFKVFQRLHGQSEFPGTGIGLAIVYKVVENHNGFISAEGHPDVGSTFTISLPKG